MNTHSERTALLKKLEELEKAEETLRRPRIDFPFAYIKTDKAGNEIRKPFIRLENTKALLDHYRITVRYNELTKDVDIEVPDALFHKDTEYNTKLIDIRNRARHHDLPVTDIEDHLIRIAEQNSFHPVREWILSAEWDGKSRLPELYATVTSPHSMKELLLRRWLVSCVAAVFEPSGISAQGLVVFTGKQGLGKTTWVKSLVPVKEWVKEGAMLDPNNKDSVITIIGHWIVELGELGSTFRKADLDALKAFITSDRDVLRPPYAEKFNKYSRRTIFFGTVNDPTFLIDNENRRFWVIDVEGVNTYHEIDLQQLWAEVYTLYKSGERFYLDREEQVELAKHNEEYKLVDPITDLLDTYVSDPLVSGKDTWHEKLCATAVLKRLGIANPSRQQVQKATDWFKDRNFGYTKEGNSKMYRVIVHELTFMELNKIEKPLSEGDNKHIKLVK